MGTGVEDPALISEFPGTAETDTEYTIQRSHNTTTKQFTSYLQGRGGWANLPGRAWPIEVRCF